MPARSIRTVVADDSVGVDDLLGPRRAGTEASIAERLSDDLAGVGFRLSDVSITGVDLGRTGDVVQAAVRARHELEREEAEIEMRQARARSDASVAHLLADVAADPALRYRESDAWRDLVAELAKRSSAMPVAPRAPVTHRAEAAVPETADGDEPVAADS